MTITVLQKAYKNIRNSWPAMFLKCVMRLSIRRCYGLQYYFVHNNQMILTLLIAVRAFGEQTSPWGRLLMYEPLRLVSASSVWQALILPLLKMMRPDTYLNMRSCFACSISASFADNFLISLSFSSLSFVRASICHQRQNSLSMLCSKWNCRPTCFALGTNVDLICLKRAYSI